MSVSCTTRFSLPSPLVLRATVVTLIKAELKARYIKNVQFLSCLTGLLHTKLPNVSIVLLAYPWRVLFFSQWFPSVTDIWSRMERRSIPDLRLPSHRILSISEVRERSPTMSAELISADSEFPARAGHVVQRRTSVPPVALPENICGTSNSTLDYFSLSTYT